MNPRNFFAELKRRNVYKVAVAYAVVSWLLIQAASIVLPTFEAPAWTMKILLVALVIGFPIAVVLAWAFEITPEGIVRAEDVAPNESITRKTGRKLIGLTVALAVIAAVLFVFQFLRPKSARVVAAPATTVAPTAAPETSTPPEKSIAVLPFENLSDDKQNAFFTDGVQDEILTDLAKVADLKVISRTSVMQYKTGTRNLQEIARALKVAHVVEGTVQRFEKRVRVTAQLIDARNDTHLWAEKYDRELADVFAIQSEIAQTIADQLQAKLSPKEKAAMQEKPTQNMAAYDLYLRAKEIDRSVDTSPERYRREAELLDQAIANDPSFVAALCLLVDAHLGAYWLNHDHTPARLELARKALDAAARLDPDAGIVHLSRGLFYYWGSRDYTPALSELTLARRSLPNDSDVLKYLAAVERRQGRWTESTAHYEQAAAFDPRNAGLLDQLAINYRRLRRYPDVIRLYDGILSWKPTDFDLTLSRAFADIDQRGNLNRLEALCAGEIIKKADANDAAGARLSLAVFKRDYPAAEQAIAAYRRPIFNDNGFVTPRQFLEGIIAEELGDSAKARAAFEIARTQAAATASSRPDDAKALSVLAQIDAELGHKDAAIREAEASVALLPLEKDALDGSALLNRLVLVYAQVGEKDRAFDLLGKNQAADLLPPYGILKLGPEWDPLRGDPRFEKIVADLAPKDGAP